MYFEKTEFGMILAILSNSMFRFLVSVLVFSFFSTSFAAPKHAPTDSFPRARQPRNACYFTSVNIALEAKYGTKLRLGKTLESIGFDGKTLATWEFKQKFSDRTHVSVREYSTKKSFETLMDQGEPVLVSTEISIGTSQRKIRHVSVAYSYDTK